ncbi:MAG TPA: ribose-5-phosphate isomerase RpiA [Mariniphaga sp.]|nr:ribose-5-phosphate isomerase RpiA [Mariniphaga sp.]
MDLRKKAAGEKAAEYVQDGMVVGLGTGTTAWYFIKRLGELISQGLFIKAVTTSLATEKQAASLNIPMFTVDEVAGIDLLVDGVDEIDPNFNAIKGGGGALFREKLIARLSKRIIWILDESKYVDAIGAFPLPVEILPFGHTHTLKKLHRMGFNPVLRIIDEDPYITDNGNYILDLHLEKHFDPHELIKKLDSVTGVLEHGLFLNMCERIIIGKRNSAEVIDNKGFVPKK